MRETEISSDQQGRCTFIINYKAEKYSKTLEGYEVHLYKKLSLKDTCINTVMLKEYLFVQPIQWIVGTLTKK